MPAQNRSNRRFNRSLPRVVSIVRAEAKARSLNYFALYLKSTKI
jgi:hypothetical protein